MMACKRRNIEKIGNFQNEESGGITVVSVVINWILPFIKKEEILKLIFH